MAADIQRESKRFLQGAAGLVGTIVVVLILLVALPAYRWFFLVSVLLGLAVAGILFVWHKIRPVKAEDVHNKRPLGLD